MRIKKKTIIISSLISLAVIFGIVTGVSYALIKDWSNKEEIKEINPSDLIEREFIKSLNLDEPGLIKLDKDSLNELFRYSRLHSNLGENNNDIGDLSIDINNDNYIFNLDLNLKFVDSKAVFNTTLTEDYNGYIFNINSSNLCKFPSIWLANKMVNLNSDLLTRIFSNAGLHIKADLENNKFTYDYIDLKKDVSILSKDILSKSRIVSGIEMIEPNISDGLNIKYSFPFKSGKAKYRSDIEAHYIDIDNSIKEAAIRGAKREAKDNVDKTRIRESFNNEISKLRNAINDNEQIDYIIEDRIKDKTISEYTSMMLTPMSDFVEVSNINEEEISNVLRTVDVIGENYLYISDSDLAYVLIDNFYVDIYNIDSKSHIFFTIGVDFAGKNILTTIDTEVFSIDNSFNFELQIKDIYFGDKPTNEKYELATKQIIIDALSSLDEKDWITYNEENSSFLIDFEHVLNKESLNQYKTIFSSGEKHISFVGNDIKNNGIISLEFKGS